MHKTLKMEVAVIEYFYVHFFYIKIYITPNFTRNLLLPFAFDLNLILIFVIKLLATI
jgi:hypothetical protein